MHRCNWWALIALKFGRHVGSQLFEADARDAITAAREILCQATPLPT
jgi:hypothetical protein